MKENLDLLKLESSNKIWSFRSVKGFPYYLMVRHLLLQGMINKNFNLSNPHLPKKLTLTSLVKYIFKSILNNPFFMKKKEVIIFSSGVVSVQGTTGEYYNRLYQDFIDDKAGNIVLIELSNKRVFFEPKKSKVFYRDFFDILIHVYTLFKRSSKTDRVTISDFVLFVKSRDGLGSVDLNKVLKNLTIKYNAGYRLYRLFFKIKKPKLIIVEDASYGGMAYLIKAARDLDIKVVEYQHGYIGLNHPAYNFDLENLPLDINKFLPSYFLTHGEHWAKNCRVPAQKFVIGYSDLLKRLQSCSLGVDSKEKNSVLFISGGTVPEKLAQFINDFIKLNPNFNVYLRPHPSERPKLKERYGWLMTKGVKIDVGDLYDILSECETIVSFSVSTVLYESIFFTDKIYLVDDEYASFYEPDSPFLRFDSPESLSAQIQSDAKLSITPDYFWAKDAEKRFSDFLQSQLKDG